MSKLVFLFEAIVWVFMPFILPVVLLATGIFCWKSSQPLWLKSTLVIAVLLLGGAWGVTAGRKLFSESYHEWRKERYLVVLPDGYRGVFVLRREVKQDSGKIKEIHVGPNGIATFPFSGQSFDIAFFSKNVDGKLIDISPSITATDESKLYWFFCHVPSNEEHFFCEWPGGLVNLDYINLVDSALERGQKMNDVIPIKMLGQ